VKTVAITFTWIKTIRFSCSGRVGVKTIVRLAGAQHIGHTPDIGP
jgi:hypothetical protein